MCAKINIRAFYSLRICIFLVSENPGNEMPWRDYVPYLLILTVLRSGIFVESYISEFYNAFMSIKLAGILINRIEDRKGTGALR